MNVIALQMLTGDRAKYLGLIFGITFATLLMAQQTSIFWGVMLRTTSQVIDVHEADIWVMDPRVAYADEIEPMPEIDVSRVRGVEGVRWAAPLFKGNAVARATDGLLQQVILMGVDDATLVGAPQKMILGNVADLKRPDAMIIDKSGYEYIWPNEPLRIGKVVELNERRAEIVGICDASPPFITNPVVFTRYSLAKQFVGKKRNFMSFVIVAAEPGVTREVLTQRIDQQTGLRARKWEDFAWDTIDHYLRRTGIPINFGITIALGFIVGAAVAGQTFYLFVSENLRQFGALKAIGVSNGRILTMVLLQSAVVGVIGFGIGIGLCALFFEVTSRHVDNLRGFFLPWQVMVGAGVAVLAIMSLVSLFSVRKVLVVDPALVFRG